MLPGWYGVGVVPAGPTAICGPMQLARAAVGTNRPVARHVTSTTKANDAAVRRLLVSPMRPVHQGPAYDGGGVAGS